MAKDTLAKLAGTMPDPEVATRLSIPIRQVKEYRKDNGIPGFRLPPPPRSSRAKKPAPRPSKAAERPRQVIRRRRGVDKKVDVPEPATPPPTTVAAAPPKRVARHLEPRPSRNPIDAFKSRLGRVPDETIAGLAGVSRGVVGAYRRKLGIAAYDGYLWTTGKARRADVEPAPASTPTPTPTPTPTHKPKKSTARRRKSKIDPVAHLVGTVPDAEVAEKAGVTRAAVAAWRKRQGIAPVGRRSAPQAAAPKPKPRPKPEPKPRPKPEPKPRPQPRSEPTAPAAAVVAVVAARAYALRATRNGDERKYFVVSATLAEACLKAEQWLGGQSGPAWQVEEISLVGDGIA